MQNKIVIAIVAILMAASFAGIVCVGDDSDAAVTSPITISTEKGDLVEGNAISYADGKVSGILKVGEDKNYVFTLVIGNILSNQKVYYTFSTDGDFKLADGSTSGVAKIKVVGDKDSIIAQLTDFKFIVTSSVIVPADITLKDATAALKIAEKAVEDAGDGATEEQRAALTAAEEKVKDVKDAITAFNNLYIDLGQSITFDLKYSQDIIEIRYAVGDLVYVKEAMKDQPYVLISLEDLSAPTPSGYKFAGWSYKLDGKENQGLAGSAVSFGDDAVLTAVFEALPEAVVTFVDGTSTLKSINVSDLNEKTVPSVEKTGYTFDGWFMGNVKVNPLTYTFEESVTLVAQWTPINCYVTFVAGDFVKTVPVLYGDLVQAPALPDGFEKWNFDFSAVITDDLTITAIEKAPEKPTGFDDPTVKMALVVVGLFICVLLAVIILKREDIRAGMVRKLSKADDKEDKKE